MVFVCYFRNRNEVRSAIIAGYAVRLFINAIAMYAIPNANKRYAKRKIKMLCNNC